MHSGTGAYFGDEGKAIVDAIARLVEVVAGEQRRERGVIGETGIKYDFHLCPSGLLTPKKIMWSAPSA